jgi:hypothetical protein
MLAAFSGWVTDSRGLIVSVYPSWQIVWTVSAWVTAALIVPGVQCGSGSENRPDPRA